MPFKIMITEDGVERDSGEGPWLTLQAAVNFRDSEVGMPCRIVHEQNWGRYRVRYIVPFGREARVDFAHMADDGEPDMLGGLSGLGGDDELMGSCWDAINNHMHEVLIAVDGDWSHVKRHIVHQYQNSGILVLWWIEDAPYEPGDTI